MEFNTIFLQGTYTYDKYNYDIKYNSEFLYNNKLYQFPLAFCRKNFLKIGTPLGTLACQAEKLAHHLAHWHLKMRSWHVSGTLAREPRWHESMLAHKTHKYFFFIKVCATNVLSKLSYL